MAAQATVFDLLKILTLTPDPDAAGMDGRGFLSDVWWSRQVPEAVYAVEASEILHPGLVQPPHDYGHRDLVLAFTTAGAGIWSLHDSRWETEPSPHLRHTVHALRDRLRQRGWSTTMMPPGRNLTEVAEQIPETLGST